MTSIKLDEATALWNEVGARGDQFRRAIRARASEEVRVNKDTIDVINQTESMEDSVDLSNPAPELPATANTPEGEK